MESQSAIKDEAAQHDRSPLEAQREWRREAENNVLDALQSKGFLAPPGDIDKTLNTIINNLEVTNGLSGQVDLHGRVMLTRDLEMFSIQNTIVISRGLIDVVPDEATLGGHAGARSCRRHAAEIVSGPIWVQRCARLSPTQILKRLKFQNEKKEIETNSMKAVAMLRKSPYADKMNSAGLFLVQLHSQTKALKQLISPRLGNQVNYAAKLMQAAPPLETANKDQIAALPLRARVKLDPYTDRVTLMKTNATAPTSAHEKMPFEVTPFTPYLTRYMEPVSVQASSKMSTSQCR